MIGWNNFIMLKRIGGGAPRGLIHLFSYWINLMSYKRRNHGIKRESINSILVIEIANIGDVVMAMPVIAALRKNFPRAKISMIVSPVSKELIEGIVDKTFTYISNFNSIRKNSISIIYQIKKFLELRKSKFDLVVDLRSDFMTLLLAAFGNVQYRVDLSSERVKSALKKMWHEIIKKPYREKNAKHEIHVKCGILRKIGVPTDDMNPHIFLDRKVRLQAQKILKNTGLNRIMPRIVIHPGASWTYKQWDVKKYAALAQQIIYSFDIHVILTGSNDDKMLVNKITSIANNPKVINLSGGTSLRQLAALMEISNLVIGNDSAAVHLAAAVGTPVIALFGPQDPRIFGPVGETVKIIKKEVPCSPCRHDVCIMPENPCMGLITVDEVFNSILKLFRDTATVPMIN